MSGNCVRDIGEDYYQRLSLFIVYRKVHLVLSLRALQGL